MAGCWAPFGSREYRSLPKRHVFVLDQVGHHYSRRPRFPSRLPSTMARDQWRLGGAQGGCGGGCCSHSERGWGWHPFRTEHEPRLPPGRDMASLYHNPRRLGPFHVEVARSAPQSEAIRVIMIHDSPHLMHGQIRHRAGSLKRQRVNRHVQYSAGSSGSRLSVQVFCMHRRRLSAWCRHASEIPEKPTICYESVNNRHKGE